MQQHTKSWGALMMAGIVAAWVGCWAMPTFAKLLAPVEVTGQTQCWDPSWDPRDPTDLGLGPPIIDCNPPPEPMGQDGAASAGVPFPTPRFTNNGNGTVTDNLMGLIWLEDAGCLGPLKWAKALRVVDTLANGRCGLTDQSAQGAWRLPNIKELQSLVLFGFSRPTLSNAKGTDKCTERDCAFLNVGQRSYFYWSSTTREDQLYKAWGVDLDEGTTLAHFKDTGEDREDKVFASTCISCGLGTEAQCIGRARPPDSFGVWPVRGEARIGLAPVEVTGQTQCWDPTDTRCPINEINCKDKQAKGQDGWLQKGVRPPTPRFDNLNNGTVRDNLTGLIWLKNANCFGTGRGDLCDGDLQPGCTWSEALDAANTLASGSCDLTDQSMAGDWCLPNVKELQSLIDFGQSDTAPALPSGHPFKGVQSNFYHSSTTRARFPDDAWAVSLRVGITDPDTSEGSPATEECQEQEPPPCVCSRFTEPDDKGRCATKYESRRVWPVKGGIRSTSTP